MNHHGKTILVGEAGGGRASRAVTPANLLVARDEQQLIEARRAFYDSALVSSEELVR